MESGEDRFERLLTLCMSRLTIEPPAEESFLVELTAIVGNLWVAFTSNQYKKKELWHSSCRVGVYGLYVISGKKEAILHFVEDSLEKTRITVPVLNLSLVVKNQLTFKVSLLYGYFNLLLFQRQLCTEHRLRLLYRNIFDGCKLQSRHNVLYFNLLSTFVDKFPERLDTPDLDNIYELVTYNTTRKDSSEIFRNVIAHPKFKQTEDIFMELLHITPWNLKLKYYLLTDLVTIHPIYLPQIDREELVSAIMYSQTKPNLGSPGGKLYYAIIRQSTYDYWKERFYSPILAILSNAGAPTLEQKSVIKFFLLNSFRQYPELAQTLLDDLNLNVDIPYFSILCVVVIALRNNILDSHFNYQPYAFMGLTHFDCNVRNLSFEILCSTGAGQPGTYIQVQDFLIHNVNDADQEIRDTMVNSFDILLKNTYIFIVKSNEEDNETVNTILSHCNLIIETIINNLSTDSNNSRVVLSMMLLELFTVYFPRHPKMDCDELARAKLDKFSSALILYQSHSRFYNKIVFMIVISKHDQCERVMNLILKEILAIGEDEIPDIDFYRYGMMNVNSHDFGVVDVAIKHVRYHLRLLAEKDKYDEIHECLQEIYEMMINQWDKIKTGRSEIIVFKKNPLHSMIALVEFSLYLFDVVEFNDLFTFIEDVVKHVVRVFEHRYIAPFTGRTCIGVARAMLNHESEFNKCTTVCMWLVLRNCCRLALRMTMRDASDTNMSRSLRIVHQIIQRCSHKGVLEEAANTLGLLVSYATENNLNADILDAFVEKILLEIPRLRASTSTVRRSVEIRTCLFAISTNDNRFDKPLFHKIMICLKDELAVCIRVPLDEQNDISTATHSLMLSSVQLIIDNSMEQLISEYLCNILMYCLLSFEFQWPVRNTALQTVIICNNRLLGPHIVPNDTRERRSVCLEELFYKHPQFLPFILNQLRLNQLASPVRLNTISPIISLLSQSYTRGSIRSEAAETNMITLENRLMAYTLDPENNYHSNLASKGYLAVCSYSNIERAINVYCSAIVESGFTPEAFVSLLNIVELLYRQLIENMNIIPGSAAIINNCTDLLNQLLEAIARTNNNTLTIICRIILINTGISTVDIKELEHNVMYACRHKDILKEIPGVWTWLTATMQPALDRIDLADMKPLCIIAFTAGSPVLFQQLFVTIIRARIAKNANDREFVTNELSDLIVEFIYNRTTIPVKYIMDECIGILIELGNLNLSNGVIRRCCFDTLTVYQTGERPEYLMPIYCLIIMQYCSEEELSDMEIFFKNCLIKCTERLIEDDYDPLIFKSIVFISRFACTRKNQYLILSVLRLCYDMLQRGIPHLDEEVSKTFMLIFKATKNYAFANILFMLNADNVVPQIGMQYTARLLIQIYVARQRGGPIIPDCHIYKPKRSLAINTHVILDQLIDCFMCLISSATAEDINQLKTWFRELAINMHNDYVENLKKFFASDPFDYQLLFLS